MIADGEYRVYLVKMPGDVRGAVRIDHDGFASIYINEALTPKEKKAVFLHEVTHIEENDFFNSRKIWEAET